MIDGTGFGVCKYAHARFIVNTYVPCLCLRLADLEYAGASVM